MKKAAAAAAAAAGEERAMEGGEVSELAMVDEYRQGILYRRYLMNQAVNLSLRMADIIMALKPEMVTGTKQFSLSNLQRDVKSFMSEICRLPHDFTPLWARLIGDNEILEETIDKFAGAILFKYASEARDLSGLFEKEKIGEAEVALKFGLTLDLLGKDIEQLRHALWQIVSSFSPENTDAQKIMTMLARQPCIYGIAKLGWILEEISMLRGMDPDVDSEVKSATLNLKSEHYLHCKENEQGNSEAATGDKKTFAAYRLCWERTWGNGYSFEDMTLLSPMQFTHCMPFSVPIDAVAGSTLQIYSIKVSAKGLAWPLEVYGVITARDSVDRQRNPLFIRTRNYCQVLTEKDPFLRLTGPVRAIVAMDTVFIETEINMKGRRKSEDVALASTVISSFKGEHFTTSLADNSFCAIELCSENLELSVQATIISIIVKSKPGSVPFPYGGKVLCNSLHGCGYGNSDGIPSRQAVVFDSVDGELIKERGGHLDLSRRVFSVDLRGRLQFNIHRYSQTDSAEIDAEVLLFIPKKWNISKDKRCLDDGSVVEITVAWSLLPSKIHSC